MFPKDTALELSQQHYENFPVTPWFIPKRYRKAIAHIYWFARTCDDLADEGNASTTERLTALKSFQDELDRIKHKEQAQHPLMQQLQQTITTFDLNIDDFYHLLQAFQHDVSTQTYATEQDIYNYCCLSANPVGSLMLQLYQLHTPERVQLSNKICTALQLINFLQDIQSDMQERQRFYFPLEELPLEGADINNFLQNQSNHAFLNQYFQHKAQQVQHLIHEGQLLTNTLTHPLKLQVQLTCLSAQRVIKKLVARQHFYERPTLTLWDGGLIACRTLGLNIGLT